MLHFLRLRQTAVNYVISLPVSTCNFVLRNPFWFQNGRNDSRTRKVLVNACKKQLRAGKIPSGQLCQINTRRFARSQNRYSNTSAGKVSAGKNQVSTFAKYAQICTFKLLTSTCVRHSITVQTSVKSLYLVPLDFP